MVSNRAVVDGMTQRWWQRGSSLSVNRAVQALLAMALTALLAGCDPSGESAVSTESQTTESQTAGDQPARAEQPLGDVAEFDGFTLRANVSPTENLPDAMAQRYGIEADPSLALLTVVILETLADQPPMPVVGELRAHYEGPAGQATDIELQGVAANDRVSYFGTLDASAQRVFQFVIEAKPEGSDQWLQMNFEVQLPDRSIE